MDPGWFPDVATVQELNYEGLTHQVIARLGPGRPSGDAQRSSAATHWGPADRFLHRRVGSFRRLVCRPLAQGISRRPGRLCRHAAAWRWSSWCCSSPGECHMLLLARNASRQREFAVRVALGASPWRLVWQSWIESVVLCAGGGLLAAGIAFPSLRLIRDLGPTTVPRLRDSVADADVLLVGLVAVIAASVSIGLLPALRARVPSLTVAMGATNARASGARSVLDGLRLEGLLTVAQVALVLLLVAVASLLLRSVTNVLTVDPGFNPYGVMAVELAPGPTPASDLAANRLFAAQLERIPGVEAVAAARHVQFVPRTSVEVIGNSSDSPRLRLVANQVASPEYFATLGIPFLAGHTFPTGPEGASSCIVNHALAQAAWPGQDPVGQIVNPGAAECTVVGVVGNTRERIETEPGPAIYFPDSGRGGAADALLIRLSSDVPAVRSTILGPDQVDSIRIDISSRRARSPTPCSPNSHPAVLRHGLRMVRGAGADSRGRRGARDDGAGGSPPLERNRRPAGRGARPADVWLMMAIFVAKLLLTGVAVGLMAAVWISRSMGSMLFNLAPSDPATLAGASARGSGRRAGRRHCTQSAGLAHRPDNLAPERVRHTPSL